ncbi:MAG: N-acetylmuramoyl-L-alanine amidase [Myxococcales bacterium]|nr:N-acetylmuramoyl-L-alanine amidase [Myxococcales bacterium]MCB9526574.1 N-acetylmuramoyl-L-alanine amidase [Myxococcales bacterium]
MATGRLIYDSTTSVGIDARVVSYAEDKRYSFYDVRDRRRRFNRPMVSRKNTVQQVILHLDGMPTAAGCFSVLYQRGLSTHLIIDWDGTVYQTLALSDTAWHAHPNNELSIGIDLNNPVRPNRLPNDQTPREIFRGRINGGTRISLGYTDAQYEALIAVLRGLDEMFPGFKPNAPVGADGRIVRNKLLDTQFKGIVGHYHVSANKWDPGPGFDWERVLLGVRGSGLYFPVTLPGTRNLAQVQKREALEAAEPYFQNTEQGTSGGYFPVGLSQQWHTGVHLHLEPGSRVVAPADGEVIVVRNDPEDERRGSANVLVMGHKMRVDGSDKIFFTVINHLRPAELSRNSPIPWVKKLLDNPGPTALSSGMDARASAKGLVALQNSRVALLEGLKVKAGELLGFSGTYNPNLDGGKPIGMIDLAVIAGGPFFARNDPRFEWVDDDEDAFLLCTSRKVWKRVVREADDYRGLVDGTWPMDPESIRRFYQTNPLAKTMRWLAPLHPTEYSADTDFSFVYGPKLDFEWNAREIAEKRLRQIRKLQWMDKGVIEHLGTPEDGKVVSYHPITFFAVLAMEEAARALQVDEQGGAKVFDDNEIRTQAAADAKREAEFAEATGSQAERTTHWDIQDTNQGRELDGGGPGDMDVDDWLRWEQGEWEPEED